VFQTVVGLVCLVAIAYAGYHRAMPRSRWPAWTRFFFLSGIEFIFIGLFLGEQFVGLLDGPTIERLNPLFSLGLGYFGLIFGLQFEYEKIRRFPAAFLASTAVQAAVTFLVVFAVFLFLFYRMDNLPALVLPAFLLAAVSCCSSPALTAMLIQEQRPARQPEIDLIRYIAGLDAVIGFTLFGVALCLTPAAPAPFGAGFPPALQWLGLSVSFGIAMGFALHLLTQVHCAESELWVFTIGILAFTAGASLFFGLSPLFVNMVAGVAAANLPGSKDRVFMMLFRQEKPFYIVFLILAGAVWQPVPAAGVLGLGLLYVAARFAGKICGGFVAARYAAGRLSVSPWIGAALISQSGVAVAMAMDLFLSGGRAVGQLVPALIAAVVFNELISPLMASRLPGTVRGTSR
jgi:Kef-type K+ transport system membrane component KefB